MAQKKEKGTCNGCKRNSRGCEGIHGFRGASWRGLVHHVVLCENTTIMTIISLALDRNFVR